MQALHSNLETIRAYRARSSKHGMGYSDGENALLLRLTARLEAARTAAQGGQHILAAYWEGEAFPLSQEYVNTYIPEPLQTLASV